MTNDTLELMEQLVGSLEKALFSEDAEFQCQKSRCESLWEQFRARHKENDALLDEVERILDEKAGMAEYRMRLRLFLDLQMGMELREIRLLPFEWETQRMPFPGLWGHTRADA